MYAIIFNPDADRWERHTDPVAEWRAQSVAEVPAVLAAAEAAADVGATVIGYLSYEAAAAFDATLPCKAAGELAQFVSFGCITAVTPPYADTAVPQLRPSLRPSDHATQMQQVRNYLQAGDCYQVNLTFPLTGELGAVDPEALFWTLYHRQPGPYACLLDFGNRVICSLSPELFFSREGERVVTEPMKGTRRRPEDTAGDQRARECLSASEKDRAENLMIVDMIRNDLGKVAIPGSVTAESLFHIRGTPTVWQQVSRISARSRVPTANLFAALFPCASITGAPKRRSMEIIDELENTPRGIYTGAVGWLRPDRRAQFNVAIRSLIIERSSGEISYGTGGGIVWDSEFLDEWEEALAKCAFLENAPPEFALLETLSWRAGSGDFDLLDEHMNRLAASAAYFGRPFDERAVRAALDTVGAAEDQRVRLLLNASGTATISQAPLLAASSPVRLRLAATPISRHDIFLRFKTTHRQSYSQARAGRSDCDDVLLWNEAGELTETTIYNVFLRRGDQLFTPDASSGLLPGTLRASMLASGAAVSARLTREDLDRADELLVGNSVRGLLPARLLP